MKEQDRHALLIWQIVPEDIIYYLIPEDLAEKWRHELESAQGKIINCDEMTHGMLFLNAALAEDVYGDDTESKTRDFEDAAQYVGLFASYKVEMLADEPLRGNIYAVYESGFYV